MIIIFWSSSYGLESEIREVGWGGRRALEMEWKKASRAEQSRRLCLLLACADGWVVCVLFTQPIVEPRSGISPFAEENRWSTSFGKEALENNSSPVFFILLKKKKTSLLGCF